MKGIEAQLLRHIQEISGQSVTLDDHPMKLLDSLGIQELLSRYRLRDTKFPSLADLRTVRSLAEFLTHSKIEDD
jgi:hypothetical protein